MNTSSQECYIDGKKYSINEFIKNEKLVLKCKKGTKTIYDKCNNEIIFCDGKKVKPYFRKLITADNPMTKWHREWQDQFNGYIEQKYECEKMHEKYRRADVDLNDTHIIEFQHSRMSKEEVSNRKDDYAKVNKNIIWVIDGNDYKGNHSIIVTELKHSNRIFLEFKTDEWKYESFIDYDVIYLNIDNKIYQIHPSLVKSKMIDIQLPISKEDFCCKLKKGQKLFEEDEKITQTTVYVSQQGAGNGKTFCASNLLSENFNNNNTLYHHYDTFVYLTKQHSAKTVIYNEFINCDKDGENKLKSPYLSKSFELVGVHKKNKKYHIELKNKKTDKIHKIIIATIDSFIFALGNGKKKGIDKFMTMVDSIIDDEFECKKSGYNKYAGGITLNKKMLLVGDEMQDLDENYVKAILKICRDRYVDFYMVGDILQSIKTENNSFTFLSKTELPNTIKLIRPKSENNVMRFGSKKLIDFVNDVIPFGKYGLPHIEKHIDNKNDGEKSNLTIFNGQTICATEKDKCIINVEVQHIMDYYKEEVEKNKMKPNDFLIVTPFTKKNPLVEALHLAIREFWKQHYKSEKYIQYSVFHKSEDGSTIDLDESANATRIVSIHTSKGDGRNVVFVIGLTEYTLKRYSEETNNLVYDSLLHVALTRMKKRLYIRVERNNDDICRRLLKYNTESSLSPYIDFSKKIELEKLTSKQIQKNYDILYQLIIKHTIYKEFKQNNEEIKEMIDIKHHIIRCASLHVLFLLSIANSVIVNNKTTGEFIPQQMYPLFKKCLTSKITQYSNTKDYNKSLFDKDNKEIPILIYENGEYKQVCDELVKTINSNKKKLEILLDNKKPKPIELDVIQSICLYHTVEVCENKYKSILPISDMYDIIDIYIKSSTDDKKAFLKSHYSKMEKIKNIYEQIDKKYPKMKWLWSKYSEFKGKTSSVKIYNSYQFIAHNDKDVVICRICPQFNELNYNQIIFDSIFDIFYLKNSSDEKGYFSNKKIIMCIVTLDKSEPYYIDFNDLIDTNRKYILCILKNNLMSSYSIKNKGLYLLYNFYKNEYNELSPYETISKIVDEVKIIDDIKPLPDYVLEFFDEIKFTIKRKNGKYDKQRQILEEYDDQECFMSEINFSMNESLNRFFGITEKDLEEINNIKYCNDETSNESLIESDDSDKKSLPEEKPKKINKSKTSTK
jgi:hypothetical protein